MTIDPGFLHQILLTEPAEFTSLVRRKPTVEFCEFLKDDDIQEQQQRVENVMKRAYRDQYLAAVQQQNSLELINELLIQLHKQIRNLVPNRKDLHSILKDDRSLPPIDDDTTSLVAGMDIVITWIIEAAQALAQLESEARVETTKSWISIASSFSNDRDEKNEKNVTFSFMVTSIMYLLDKAEQCEKDKNDFYVTEILAPKLHSSKEGLKMEQEFFSKKFGPNPSFTRKWIQSLLKESTEESNNDNDTLHLRLRESKVERRNWIRRSWINEILFRHQEKKQLELPEIFMMDLSNLKLIREKTRTAAAGCSLGLLACQTLQLNSEILLNKEASGASLVKVMKQKKQSVREYEQAVEDAFISLAQSWKEDSILTPEEVEALRGQAKSVLRGKNPVIKILDDRMRNIFAELVVQDLEGIPLQMTTGRQSPSLSSNDQEKESAFVIRARMQFRKRGLAFFEQELANASKLATKIGNLSCELYMEEFLDQIILEELNNFE